MAQYLALQYLQSPMIGAHLSLHSSFAQHDLAIFQNEHLSTTN